MRYLWFPGIDPARDADYLTVVINGLPADPATPWIPKLKDLYRFRNKSLTDCLKWIIDVVFKTYPPTLGYVDETHDPTFAEILSKRYPNRINPLRFGNTGSTNTKLDLKLIGRNYLKTGYTIPDVDELLRKNLITSDKAFLVNELKQESFREITKLTSTDRITFEHSGKHNDLVHAQEMSLKAVMEFQQKRGLGIQAEYFEGAASDIYESLDMPITRAQKARMFAKKFLENKATKADSIEVSFSS